MSSDLNPEDLSRKALLRIVNQVRSVLWPSGYDARCIRCYARKAEIGDLCLTCEEAEHQEHGQEHFNRTAEQVKLENAKAAMEKIASVFETHSIGKPEGFSE